jgi:hypothetical protein
MFLLWVFHEFLETNRHFTLKQLQTRQLHDRWIGQGRTRTQAGALYRYTPLQFLLLRVYQRSSLQSTSANNIRRLKGKNTKCFLEHLTRNDSICLMTNSVLPTYAKPQVEHRLNTGVPKHFSSLTSNGIRFISACRLVFIK